MVTACLQYSPFCADRSISIGCSADRTQTMLRGERERDEGRLPGRSGVSAGL